MTPDPTRPSVVVIGAGQAGLSVAYYLRRLGLTPAGDFVILDRGPDTGGAWQHRWAALRVGSAHRINDLPGMAELGLSFERADRHQPARVVVADYYRAYENHFGLGVRRPAVVTAVTAQGKNLVVRFTDVDGDHELPTEIVVNATGTWGSPFVPWYPGLNDFRGRHVRTSDYVAAEEFAGQSVVVVGAGTSAIGSLLELEHVASELCWVTRREVAFLDEGDFDLEARLAAVARQDEAARAGRALPSIVSGTGIPRTRRIAAGIERGLLVARPMFERIEADGVRFADGSFRPADAIIWATGFRPELRQLAPLALRETAGGIQVTDGAVGRDGRVFLAGYGPQASTIGANRAGRTIARQVVALLGTRGEP